MNDQKKFIIICDSSCNLTEDLLEKYDIKIIPYIINVDGKDVPCYEKGISLEKKVKELSEKMKNGAKILTSLVNGERFQEAAEPYLKEGKDVLFISLSSGISGTFVSANNACKKLMKKYPERKCYAVDSLAASLGEGLLAIEAANLRDQGKSVDEVKAAIDASKKDVRQIFTVDDLKNLLAGGRISRLTATVGTLLQIKPLLKGNEEGKIVSYGKVKGMKKALRSLAEEFAATVKNPKDQVVAIAHFCAEENAKWLAETIKAMTGVKDVIISYYDMCTGVHVGIGTVALFYKGAGRA